MVTKLIIDKVTVNYSSVKALDNVSLELRKGELVFIIGPNGAGKTTLLKTINKIVETSLGAVYLDGKNIAKMDHKEIALHVAYSSTDIHRGFGTNVGDLILMGRYPRMGFIPSQKDKEKVDETVKKLKIESLIQRRLDEISDGERRKVLLGKLLAQETEVLLVDEPLSHLDLKAQVEIVNLLRMEANSGKLVIATSHVIDLPARFCDKMIIMKKGKIVAMGGIREVLQERILEEVYEVKCKVIYEEDLPVIVVKGPLE